jgi:molybdenum storage protein
MKGRHELESKLKGESLVRKGLLRRYENREQVRIAPQLNIVKIGGHGIIDYGAPVVLPLVEEIGKLSKQHQLLVVTGGGVRVRHILDIGLEQNAIMLAVLLSKYNAMRIHVADLLEITMLLAMGILPVIHGTPPYGLYEHPPEIGMIPPHRTDTGAFLMAEVLGAKNCILLKNVDGLYTEDPFKNPNAELIEDVTADELLEMDLEDLVLERKVIELLRDAHNIREVKIVNGHKPGTLTKVLRGEKVGTIIRSA